MDVAAIILRRDSGELFVHQRLADKRVFPNLFGLGAGGKIEEGETDLQGAKRELKEETGIDAEPIKLFEFDFSNSLVSYRMHVFELVTEQEVVFDDKEWQWGGWLMPEKISELDDQSKLCPDTSIFYKRYLAEFLN